MGCSHLKLDALKHLCTSFSAILYAHNNTEVNTATFLNRPLWEGMCIIHKKEFVSSRIRNILSLVHISATFTLHVKPSQVGKAVSVQTVTTCRAVQWNEVVNETFCPRLDESTFCTAAHLGNANKRMRKTNECTWQSSHKPKNCKAVSFYNHL